MINATPLINLRAALDDQRASPEDLDRQQIDATATDFIAPLKDAVAALGPQLMHDAVTAAAHVNASGATEGQKFEAARSLALSWVAARHAGAFNAYCQRRANAETGGQTLDEEPPAPPVVDNIALMGAICAGFALLRADARAAANVNQSANAGAQTVSEDIPTQQEQTDQQPTS